MLHARITIDVRIALRLFLKMIQAIIRIRRYKLFTTIDNNT